MNGNEIKEIRAKIGVSQKKLAEMLNVHWRTVQNWEKTGDISHDDYTNLCALIGGEYQQLKPQQYAGGCVEDADPATLVPLLPVSAQGGTLNDFVVSVKDTECEKIISPISGADFAMAVAGESMSPEYPSGSQILIKKINERAFIDWGKVHVLDTENGTVIKKLMPAKDPDKVLCVSINPNYPPFEVSFEHIFGVYRVLMCMAIK